MSNQVNAPRGLVLHNYSTGGADNVIFDSNYTVSTLSAKLNQGDPLTFAPQGTQQNVASGFSGENAMVMQYTPVVTVNGAANRTVITPANGGVVGATQCGVFHHAEYTTSDGVFTSPTHFDPLTVTNGERVKIFITKGKNQLYRIKLGTWFGADPLNGGVRFSLMPSMQVQDGTWPLSGAVGATPTAANGAVIGSNLTLMVGRGPLAGAGGTGSLTTITRWDGGPVAGYRDNPIAAEQGKALGNPFGVSNFYACPSLASDNTDTSLIDGRSEYDRAFNVAGNLKFHGFVNSDDNRPDTFGQRAANTVGNYYNTPFLEVIVSLNNHCDVAGTPGTTLIA